MCWQLSGSRVEGRNLLANPLSDLRVELVSSPFLYGVFSWYGIDAPISARLSSVRNAGFDATTLWWGDDLAFREYNKSDLIRQVQMNDLLLENIHVPFKQANDIWSVDDARRNHILHLYRGWLTDCNRFGIPTMVMHISRGNTVEAPNGFGLKSIEVLTKDAERLGVNIALENTRSNHLLKYLLDRIQSHRLGVCYDTSHAVLYGDEEFNVLSEYGARLLCLHISDNDGLADRHWAIGDGGIDWDAFSRAFPKQYEGILSAEVVTRSKEQDSEGFLMRTLASLQDLGSRIAEAR